MVKATTFWGKAGRVGESHAAPYHPTICHMLDVALVALYLLDQTSTPARTLLFRALDCSFEEGIRWLAFIIALHDLGKVSPGFVDKRADLDVVQVLRDQGFPFFSDVQETDHGRVTAVTLGRILSEATECPEYVANAIALAVGGHHGRFRGEERSDAFSRSDESSVVVGDGPWILARREMVEALRAYFGLEWKDFPFGERTACSPFLLTLAGLTSVADWIGSDETLFQWVGGIDDFTSYGREREKVARNAVSRINLDRGPLTAGKSRFEDLFPFAPNETQQAALEALAATEGPTLLLIETPMGSGKTEAALAAVDILIRERGAAGFYYALPTQATGNQMFRRVKKYLEKHPARTAGGVELHLLHGRSDLNPDYKDVKPSALYDKDGNRESAVRASSWFKSRKRGLISPCAVGTVDQALMAALQVRHMFVRLYGLAGKVVVIDEVHAYDTYTSTILYSLVEWLGALGTSVILLSATLPEKRRADLLRAYAGSYVEIPEMTYPSVAAMTRDGKIKAVPVCGLETKTLYIAPIRTSRAARFDATAKILREQLAGGGNAACIVNTVRDAQRLFEHLKESLRFEGETEFILFHARFPFAERFAIERRVEDRFGKGEGDEPNPKRPKRAVVVATQVLEQSLDVDFDVMVTDIAPIDLILQRGGRVQRHAKNDAIRCARFFKNAVLYCLIPDELSRKTDYGDSSHVYEPVVLLKSALAIDAIEGRKVNLPESVQDLISSVYGPKDVECPEGLIDIRDDWKLEKAFAGRREELFASQVVLPQPQPEGDDPEILCRLDRAMEDTDELPKSTRLGRPSINIVTLHQRGGRTYIDRECTRPVDLSAEPSFELTKALVERSVSLSTPNWYVIFNAEEVPVSWKKSALLHRYRAAVFTNGRLIRGISSLRDDPELGILVEGKEDEDGDI